MGGAGGLPASTRERLIPELRQRPGTHIFLAFQGELPAGVLISFEGFSTFAARPLLNIHDLAVHPDFRRKGLARQLMAHAEDVARELGCCKLTLEVLEGNGGARKLYDTIGFISYELRPETGRALFLEKPLD